MSNVENAVDERDCLLKLLAHHVRAFYYEGGQSHAALIDINADNSDFFNMIFDTSSIDSLKEELKKLKSKRNRTVCDSETIYIPERKGVKIVN